MMNKTLLLLIGAAVLLSGVSAHAANDTRLRRVEEAIEAKKTEQEKLDAAALQANASLKDLQAKMVILSRSLQEKESEQERYEKKLAALKEEVAEKSKDVDQKQQRFSMMMSALIGIASRPPESLFLQERIAEDHIHRSVLLRAILPQLKVEVEKAGRGLAALHDVRMRYEKQARLVDAARTNLREQKESLDQMIATRQGFLRRTEAQKQETAKRLESLAREAHNLRQLMERVAPVRRRAPKGTGDVALAWPVVGEILKTFGEKDADGVRSEGLTLEAPPGAPIVAPYDGRVVFAGPFRGYGQILILQHDNGCHSFLSGFGRIDAEVGQDVIAGEPLGVLPVKVSPRPELYFEWRRGDTPMNPLKGLRKKS
ncbi:MAG: peptidoglycan DD-metalloendopeptidase family protein [Alphaproteobacteria bacterium]|nr:peptidoglycan DD-metalloendopeptidase family protein [Alphaproteobacteria bacterium]